MRGKYVMYQIILVFVKIIMQEKARFLERMRCDRIIDCETDPTGMYNRIGRDSFLTDQLNYVPLDQLVLLRSLGRFKEMGRAAQNVHIDSFGQMQGSCTGRGVRVEKCAPEASSRAMDIAETASSSLRNSWYAWRVWFYIS